MVSSIFPKSAQNLLSWLLIEDAQDSEFLSFFGRIEEVINCFRDLLTFIFKKKNLSKSLNYYANAKFHWKGGTAIFLEVAQFFILLLKPLKNCWDSKKAPCMAYLLQ